ncbi:MAG: hypothetical protein EOO88_29905, partial [Pedobacter sp.]
MEIEKLTYLYQQSLRGGATHEEQEEWLAAVSDPANQAAIQELMAGTWYAIKDAGKQDMPVMTSEVIFHDIIKRKQSSDSIEALDKQRSVLPLWKYAAAIAAAVATIVFG